MKLKWTARLNTRVFALATDHIKITKGFGQDINTITSFRLK